MLAIIYTLVILWVGERAKLPMKYFYYASFPFLLVGILMFGYGKVFFSVPLFRGTFGLLDPSINMETQWLFLVFPFFMMGYGLNCRKAEQLVDYKHCGKLFVLVLAVYVLELAALQVLSLKCSTTLCFMTYPLVYLLFVFVFKRPHVGTTKVAKYSSGMASFMYFSHILFALILQSLGFSETPVFCITVGITALLGALIVWSNYPVLKRLM